MEQIEQKLSMEYVYHLVDIVLWLSMCQVLNVGKARSVKHKQYLW